MIIYDQLSIAFIKRMNLLAKDILASLNIKTYTTTFSLNDYRFPLKIVVFEGRELGYFDSSYYQIGLNRRLVYQAKDSVLRDILKHELAHYLTFIHYGHVSKPHGVEFQDICRRYHFKPEVAKSTMDLESSNDSKEGDLTSEKVLEKVKKLLSLAQSSNSHEAELATIKANEILLKHNLSYIENDDEPIYMLQVLRSRKVSGKMRAIIAILHQFMVFPVLSKGEGTICIEISGSLTNVKLAEYIAGFLNVELDHLWTLAQKEYNFKGIRAKNSFFIGIAQGFLQKMKDHESAYNHQEKKALIVIKNKVQKRCRELYGKMSSSKSQSLRDESAHFLGSLKGQELSIKKALSSNDQSTLYLTE